MPELTDGWWIICWKNTSPYTRQCPKHYGECDASSSPRFSPPLTSPLYSTSVPCSALNQREMRKLPSGLYIKHPLQKWYLIPPLPRRTQLFPESILYYLWKLLISKFTATKLNYQHCLNKTKAQTINFHLIIFWDLANDKLPQRKHKKFSILPAQYRYSTSKSKLKYFVFSTCLFLNKKKVWTEDYTWVQIEIFLHVLGKHYIPCSNGWFASSFASSKLNTTPAQSTKPKHFPNPSCVQQ